MSPLAYYIWILYYLDTGFARKIDRFVGNAKACKSEATRKSAVETVTWYGVEYLIHFPLNMGRWGLYIVKLGPECGSLCPIHPKSDERRKCHRGDPDLRIRLICAV